MKASYRQNCNLEDVAAEIGYRATRILAGWYSGRNLSVPVKAKIDHPLSQLIGYSAFQRLVAGFAGQQLSVRSMADDLRIHQDRRAADAFAAGKSTAEVALLLNITDRHARAIRAAMKTNGLIDYARLDV